MSEVFDSGVTNADTTTFTYGGQGSLTHQLNALNAIGLSVSGSSQSFSNDGSIELRDQRCLQPEHLSDGGTVLDSRCDATDQSHARRDDRLVHRRRCRNHRQRERERNRASTRRSFPNASILRLGAGGNVVRTSGSVDDTTSGFIGNAALTYALPNTTLSAFASHNLAPSSLGSLQERSTAGFSVGHQINEFSSVFFSGAFVYQQPIVSVPANLDLDQQHQALVLSAGYQRSLGQNWNLGLTYTFTQQNNGDDEFFAVLNDGSSTSNAVFATLTRNFNLWGGPQPPAGDWSIPTSNGGTERISQFPVRGARPIRY